MKTNDVVTVVTVSGEYVGRLDNFSADGTVTLKDPRMLITQAVSGIQIAV